MNENMIISENLSIEEMQKEAILRISKVMDSIQYDFMGGISVEQQLRYLCKADLAKAIIAANDKGTLTEFIRANPGVSLSIKIEGNLDNKSVLEMAQDIMQEHDYLIYNILPLIEVVRRSLKHKVLKENITKQEINLLLKKVNVSYNQVLEKVKLELGKGTNIVSIFSQITEIFDNFNIN